MPLPTKTAWHRVAGFESRNRPLSFSFNGKRKLQGYQGDTIASALLANGVSTVNRSFKYHRPRGIMSAGVEETNALLTVSDGNGDIACGAYNRTGLDRRPSGQVPTRLPGASTSTWVGCWILRTKLWTAGFYNKVFKWPNWHWYEDVCSAHGRAW